MQRRYPILLIGGLVVVFSWHVISCIKSNKASNQSTLLELSSNAVTPPLLVPGDTVAIVAPAWAAIDKNNVFKSAMAVFRRWGLQVLVGNGIGVCSGQFAGVDSLRVSDVQHMLDDPHVKAIFAYRGGYGTNRIIDVVDFSKFVKNPKWFIGFSDLTTFLIRIEQLGLVSIHGQMIKNFLKDANKHSLESLRIALFEGTATIQSAPHPCNRIGEARGKVVGGNLITICSNIGTQTDLNTKGKILVIEEIGEQLYAIDRMMVQLKRAGKLKDLAGLVVGNMTKIGDKPSNRFGKSVQALILEHVANYSFPVGFNFPIGHIPHNLAFLHGAVAELTISDNGGMLCFQK
jgi:muramoyltetrapeptide carboxypeptidase